jgi:3-hydroxymyristoyl/3-hydroxydecanoyl-(acyl carrier protein) dehydratase
MTGLTKEDQTLTSRFLFPQGFIGFQGHFPAKKILPGVCQIQCALSTIEKGNEQAVSLKEIVLAKYFAPVFPEEEMTCAVTLVSDSDGDRLYKAVLKKGAVKVTELKLRVALNPEEKRQAG